MEQAEQLPGVRSVRVRHLAHAKSDEQEMQTRACARAAIVCTFAYSNKICGKQASTLLIFPRKPSFN